MTTAPRRTAGVQHLADSLTAAFPARKLPDGWIGDAAHRGRNSSHNPDDTPGSKPEWDGDPDSVSDVRGLDADADLGPGVDSLAVPRHLAGLPGLARVMRYMIHKGLIWHVNNGFRPVKHTGDQHPDHIHFTTAFTEAADDNTTFDYQLEEIPVALTEADKKWISQNTAAIVADAIDARVGPAVWNHTEIDPQSTTTPPGVGRMAGWARTEKQRADARLAVTLAAIAEVKAALPTSA